jgi:hypothetical protein
VLQPALAVCRVLVEELAKALLGLAPELARQLRLLHVFGGVEIEKVRLLCVTGGTMVGGGPQQPAKQA